MTDRAEVTSRLCGAFRTCFFDQSIEITDATTVDDVDGWDSLSHVRLMLCAERAFGIDLPPDETARLKIVGELIDYISARLDAS